MKKMFIVFLALALAASVVSANNPGAIWTTNGDCGDNIQDVNHYAIGDRVFINGDGFASLTEYNWDVTGQPGEASCDHGAIVAQGAYVTNDTGAFCFEAYTVANDDCGEYKVGFGKKGDNYRVDEPQIPEFGVVAAIVALVGAVAVFTVTRKN